MKIEYEFETTVDEERKRLEVHYGARARLERKVKAGLATFQERADLDRWHRFEEPDAQKLNPIRTKKAMVFHDPVQFFKFLSPERVRILDHLRADADVESLNELAHRLGRDPKNVYEDVRALEKRGLVTIERRNRRRSIPHVAVGRVTITV